MDSLLADSAIVISHAGAGSILRTLRTKSSTGSGRRRPILIVAANATLMNNHQRELAEAMRDDGYVLFADHQEKGESVEGISGETEAARLARALAEQLGRAGALLAPAKSGLAGGGGSQSAGTKELAPYPEVDKSLFYDIIAEETGTHPLGDWKGTDGGG